MPKKDVTIEIFLDQDSPEVRCADPTDCVDGVAQVWQEKHVEWRGAEEGRAWTVVFLAEDSPFHKEQRVFSSDDPRGKLDKKDATKDKEFAYCVSYQNEHGAMRHSDPRIMVRG